MGVNQLRTPNIAMIAAACGFDAVYIDLEQLGPNAWPVLTQVIPGVVDGHPIHARAALVASNAFARSYEVLSVAHLLH